MTKYAVAYYRTSSATNVGADKDSLKRQKEAVANYAKSNKIEIVREFYDAAVSGSALVKPHIRTIKILSSPSTKRASYARHWVY